jgi:predicted XRE-type DNA-binding protein
MAQGTGSSYAVGRNEPSRARASSILTRYSEFTIFLFADGAERIAREMNPVSNRKRYETGTRNVFKDIGVPNAEEHLVKAQLVFKIDAIMKDRGLKQVEAADLFGVRQPDVSKMLRGEFR